MHTEYHNTGFYNVHIYSLIHVQVRLVELVIDLWQLLLKAIVNLLYDCDRFEFGEGSDDMFLILQMVKVVKYKSNVPKIPRGIVDHYTEILAG